MKEIIGDDYPTYEDSVNATLAEKQKEGTYTYLKEVEDRIHKDNLERLLKENLELRHRLSCIEEDLEHLNIFVNSYCKEIFNKPTSYAERAFDHLGNIEIACDLNCNESLDWNLDNLNKDLAEDSVFQGHLKHMESVDEYSSKYKGKK